jgi:hypothetical protein
MNTTNALTAPVTIQWLGPNGELNEVDLPPAEVLALAAGRGELPEPVAPTTARKRSSESMTRLKRARTGSLP